MAMASGTVEQLEQLERDLARKTAILEIFIEKWKRDRKITVRQLRELADEIQQHEDKSRIAKIFGSSAGIVGGGLTIAGFVGAFFTFGATLGLMIAGGVISGVGGATVVGTEIANNVLRSGKLKQVNRALEKDKEDTIKLYEKLEKHEGIMEQLWILIKQSSKGEIAESVLRGVDKVRAVVEGGLRLGKVIGNEAGETMFKTLGNVGRGFHVAGFVFGTVFIGLDIYTLVKTSIDIHKGCRVKVADDILEAAQVLEDQTMPSFMDDNEP